MLIKNLEKQLFQTLLQSIILMTLKDERQSQPQWGLNSECKNQKEMAQSTNKSIANK